MIGWLPEPVRGARRLLPSHDTAEAGSTPISTSVRGQRAGPRGRPGRRPPSGQSAQVPLDAGPRESPSARVAEAERAVATRSQYRDPILLTGAPRDRGNTAGGV